MSPTLDLRSLDSSCAPFNGWLFELVGANTQTPEARVTIVRAAFEAEWTPGADPWSKSASLCHGFLPPGFDEMLPGELHTNYSPRQARALLLAAGFREAPLQPHSVRPDELSRLDAAGPIPRLTSNLTEAAIRGRADWAAKLAPGAPQPSLFEAMAAAAARGHLECLQALIPWADFEGEPGPDFLDEGLGPLMSAARWGRLECARALLEAGSAPFHDGEQMEMFHSPISMAAEHGHLPTFELLLAAGARQAADWPDQARFFLDISQHCERAAAALGQSEASLFHNALHAELARREAQSLDAALPGAAPAPRRGAI